MAIKSNVKVIPVGIHGTFKPFSKVYVNYGEPIDLSKYKNQKDKLDEATEIIMEQIVMLTKKEDQSIICLLYTSLPIFTALLIMILDKKPIRPMIKGLLCYPLFLGSWLLINFKCLFKRDTSWDKIEHVRNIKIKDVDVYKRQ